VTLDGAKVLFADESWLLFRQSGTEPVLRIYSEATSFEKRDALLMPASQWRNKSNQVAMESVP
jgi:phosphomannomutase